MEGIPVKAAGRFLDQLQWNKVLCSDPTQHALSIRFPHLIVEGKAYSTGGTIFEAQNQAAVSGSCMTNLQHQLAELTASAAPRSSQSTTPLAFSVCTEGPHMELWVHYTVSEEGVRTYHMNILKTCHAALPEGVTEFLAVLDSVMAWASVEFVKDIVEQLALVAKAAGIHVGG